jgi:hypothetical protein
MGDGEMGRGGGYYGERRCGRGTRWIPRAHRPRGTLRWRCGIGLRFHSHMPPCLRCESTLPRGRPPCEGCAQATKKVGISSCVELCDIPEFSPSNRHGIRAPALGLFGCDVGDLLSYVVGQACTGEKTRQLKWGGEGKETCTYARKYAYEN